MKEERTLQNAKKSQSLSLASCLISRLINPIIIKEMRGQMRGPRAFIILTAYLAGLGGLTYALYRMTLTSFAGYTGVSPQSAYVGQTLFYGLAFLVLLCVCFITPTLTAGAISGEQERRTYDMLLSTPLRPFSILWGKMVASLMWIFMLILAAVPLSSLIFIFGGIALRDIIQVIGILGLVAVTYGSLGMFFSALTRRTGQATVFTYLIVMAFIFGGVFFWVGSNIMGRGDVMPRGLACLSPIGALASALITPEGTLGPVGGLSMLLVGGTDWFHSSGRLFRPLWQYTTAVYLALTVMLWLVTAQLVRPVRRWRLGWKGWLLRLFIVLLLAGELGVVFGSDWGTTGLRASSPQPFPAPTAVPVASVPVAWEVVDLPTATPPPTPTPVPLPTPPSPAEVEEMLEGFVVQNLMQNIMPQDYERLFNAGAFCDLEVLDISGFAPDGRQVQASLWVYCRVYSAEDGELQPGVGLSLPLVASLFYDQNGLWRLDSYYIHAANMLSPEVRQHLLVHPYDEAMGEARLRERAREALLGEE